LSGQCHQRRAAQRADPRRSQQPDLIIMEMTPELIAVMALGVLALILAVLCVLIYRARPADLSATVAALEASLQAAQQDCDNQNRQQAQLRQELAALAEANTRHREQISQLQTTLEQERLQNAE